MRFTAAPMLILLAPSLVLAQGRPLVVENANVLARHTIEVPVEVNGTIAELFVEEGTVVKAGDPLLKIRDDIALKEVEGNRMLAESDAAIDKALATVQEYETRLNRSEKLGQFDSIEARQLIRTQIAVATEDSKVARMEKARAGVELAKSLLTLKRHTVLAPIGGVIAEKLVEESEAVQAQQTVLKLIDVSSVKVRGSVPLRRRDRVSVGQDVMVYPNKRVGELHTLPGHSGEIHAVATLPDGRHAVSAGADGKVLMWDIEDGRFVRVVGDLPGQSVYCLAVSPQAPHYLVGGTGDGQLYVWNLDGAGGREPAGRIEVGSSVRSVAIDPTDPQVCVTGSSDGEVIKWNLAEGETPVATYHGHKDYVTSLSFSADGETLLSAGGDGTVRIWDMASGEERLVSRGRGSDDVEQVALSADGRSFLFNSYAVLQVRDAATDVPRQTIETDTIASFSGVALFSPGGDFILTGESGANNLQLWERNDDGSYALRVRTYVGHTAEVNSVAFTPGGVLCVSGGADRVVRVWAMPTAAMVAAEKQTGRLTFISPVANSDETVEVQATVDNASRSLTPGTMSTLVIGPSAPPTTAAR